MAAAVNYMSSDNAKFHSVALIPIELRDPTTMFVRSTSDIFAVKAELVADDGQTCLGGVSIYEERDTLVGPLQRFGTFYSSCMASFLTKSKDEPKTCPKGHPKVGTEDVEAA